MKHLLTTTLFFLFAVLAFQTPIIANDPPNIVFLFADDQRADTIGAHGNDHIQTPNLDRLAREGFSFRNNYCAGSFSGAVCIASRAMLMTGQHWQKIKSQSDTNHWEGLPMLPEIMASEGDYETFAVGKWHNGPKTLKRGFRNGASIYLGGMHDHKKFQVQDMVDGELTEKRDNSAFSSEQFADSAVSFIENADSNKPFFLYVAFTAPHDPRNPPEKYRQMYYEDRPPLPKNFLPQHPFVNSNQTQGGRDENLGPWPRTPEVVNDQLCEYYGLITHLDEQVGKIMAAIEASPNAKNTIVVYTADHGLAMGSHGLLGKQNVYEQSMKSPLIIRGPKIPAGGSSNASTYIHDLYATVCQFSNVNPPKGIDAVDLSPIWKGEQESVHESIFLPYQDSQRSINDGRWKLHVYPLINHRLLFDLKSDPFELNNLANEESSAGELTRLNGLMDQWRVRLDDADPLSVDEPKNKEPVFHEDNRRPDRWQPDWIREKYFYGRRPKGQQNKNSEKKK